MTRLNASLTFASVKSLYAMFVSWIDIGDEGRGDRFPHKDWGNCSDEDLDLEEMTLVIPS
jgi:hypothetical protein